MIRGHRQLFGRKTYTRTYDAADWKNNCIQYLDEARETARNQRPAKVVIYVKTGRHKDKRAEIICN